MQKVQKMQHIKNIIKYHQNIIKISSKYHQNIIDIEFIKS